MARDMIAVAKRLKDATPEDIQMFAKHDWDMIRDLAIVALAYMPNPCVRLNVGEDPGETP